jgi:hypothetical protein
VWQRASAESEPFWSEHALARASSNHPPSASRLTSSLTRYFAVVTNSTSSYSLVNRFTLKGVASSVNSQPLRADAP